MIASSAADPIRTQLPVPPAHEATQREAEFDLLLDSGKQGYLDRAEATQRFEHVVALLSLVQSWWRDVVHERNDPPSCAAGQVDRRTGSRRWIRSCRDKHSIPDRLLAGFDFV